MGIDVYDYTLLHKKGLLKLPERESAKGVAFTKDGDIDFTKMNVPSEEVVMPQIISDSSSSTSQSAPSDNAFSFLDSFAQSASSAPSAPVMPQIADSGDMTHVRQRLDAIDYSLNRLLDRLQSIEEKLARNP